MIAATVERLARDSSVAVRTDATWVYVQPAGVVLPAHGWKLHISSRPSTFPDLVSTVVPFLLAEAVAFKLAKSTDVLSRLNDAYDSPASVGKAFTIYPDAERVRELGLRLVELLRGRTGPRILSDLRVDQSAPVYYRYGPFTSGRGADRRGRIGVFLHGPGGEAFQGEATTRYRTPSWAADPFADDRRALPIDDSLLLSGGRYQITEGVYESPRGNVYRAIDTSSREPVIVKQARALVAESDPGIDARLRLRNERRVLEAADGIAGVPRFVDHFQHADDEFLVTTDLGPVNLVDRILRDGPYGVDEARNSLARLTDQLVSIVAALHERGIVMRDVAPKNIVLDTDGTVGLVDFGIAAYDGLHLPGTTPGYSPTDRPSGLAPQPNDDLYALGMTLIHAMTGVSPVVLEAAQWARNRALQAVHVRYGSSPPALVAAIVDLLNDDEAVVRTAFDQLRLRERERDDFTYTTSTPLPTPPTPTAELIVDITAHVLDEVLGMVDSLVREAERARRPDASVYTGTAGVGLELLHHKGSPGVPERLSTLADVTSRFAERADLGPGLFLGRTGVEHFLRAVRTDSDLSYPDFDEPLDDDDLISGAAGIGLGHYWRYGRDGDQRDLDVALHYADQIARTRPTTYSLAHGLAGILLLQLTVDPSAEPTRRHAELLAARMRELVEQAEARAGDPLMTVSWCNGLTGMARVLLFAGQRLDRPDYIEVVLRVGEALTTWVPRMESTGQCCGAAGIGDFLLDLSSCTGAERFHASAFEAARHLFTRSAGPPDRPSFVNPVAENAVAWSGGLTGVLGFFRRLRDGGGPRLFPGL